jgi:hypothetical protein
MSQANPISDAPVDALLEHCPPSRPLRPLVRWVVVEPVNEAAIALAACRGLRRYIGSAACAVD